jgi:hypothetical protein
MIRRLLLTVMCGLAIFAADRVHAGPPPVDPKQMSGIPRVDPQLAVGTVTVRVLDGGFEAPATDVTVTLEITAPEGKDTRTATTDAQGRATFTGLESFVGGTAIAKATRGNEELASQPMSLAAEAGTRVMLVAAGAGRAAAPRHGEAGGPEVPNPGTAFVLEGTPAGELVVGTFDLTKRKPIGGIEVTLQLTSPSGEVTTRKATSDARGKVAFDKLLPPETPSGTKLEVSATLIAGEPVKTSSVFEMDTKVGMALVLANGELGAQPQPQAEPAPQGRAPVPGPRIMPSLPTGTVRVHFIDANDAPLANQPLTVVKKDQSGNDISYEAKTDARGNADVVVDVQSDAVYLVLTRYDGGPYSSSFFQVDKRGGIAVDMRLFATTSDLARVRSVVQFDVDALENDLARVVQVQDMLVAGDEAFWPEGGMQILPAVGGKNVTVLPVSEEWLNHEEKAPYATLAGPIPPGEVARVAIAYVVEHDGTAKVEFTTGLDTMESAVLVGDDQTLTATGATKSDRPTPIPGKSVWNMGPRGPGVKLEFSVSGLVRRNPIYRTIGLFGALALGVVVIAALATRPRVSPRERLRVRRDELLAMLDGVPASNKAKRARIVAALDHVWRQLDVLERGQPGAPATPTKE